MNMKKYDAYQVLYRWFDDDHIPAGNVVKGKVADWNAAIDEALFKIDNGFFDADEWNVIYDSVNGSKINPGTISAYLDIAEYFEYNHRPDLIDDEKRQPLIDKVKSLSYFERLAVEYRARLFWRFNR